jgi:dihydrodipicolinate synthase/N-acetylneuraminate lyase
MTSHWQDWPPQVLAALRQGVVIPAHPLALNADRKLDARRQRALTRYYLDAGAGGLAVGVHTTQFAIREAALFEPVLELAMRMRSAAEWAREPKIMIAGLVGRTAQAIKEAEFARGLGYHAGLLSLAALKGASEDELIAHAQTVAREIPLVGFYLQPAVGGLVLPVSFWRRFAAIENVVAIKVAPFNRYRTLDVVRGVVEADAADRVTLYTGNDDHIILDLVTPFAVAANVRERTVRIKGGLLGHWSVWVKRAVELLERTHAAVAKNDVSAELLALDAQVTDCNAAIFDAANDFHGVIAGCHEILRRQGLLEGIWCLDQSETLGSGQKQEIDRVCAAYPHLNDDAFVRANLQRWLA